MLDNISYIILISIFFIGAIIIVFLLITISIPALIFLVVRFLVINVNRKNCNRIYKKLKIKILAQGKKNINSLTNNLARFRKYILSKLIFSKRFISKFWQLILVSIFGVIILFAFHYSQFNTESIQGKLTDISNQIIKLAGIVSAIIIGFMSGYIIQIRRERIDRYKKITKLSQKVHYYRSILSKLLHDNYFFPRGLWGYMNYHYKNLTFFDIRDHMFVGSTEMSDEVEKFYKDSNYSDIKEIFLDMKTLVGDIPFDDTLYSEFESPITYNIEILEKWVKYKSGRNLYYCFDYKRALYLPHFNFGRVYQLHVLEIEKTALLIDKERYAHYNFSPQLLAKLGSHFTDHLIPELYRLQYYNEEDLPEIIYYLYKNTSMLIVFGVILPLISILLNLHYYFLLLSITIIIANTLYILLTLLPRLNKEIKL